MLISEATILVVDDEPQLTRIFAAWMQRCGCLRVFTAGNGVEALEVLQRESVDVVISDVRMPLMDGITLLRRITELEMFPPGVIFVSGFCEIDKAQSYACGLEAVLTKPLTLADLEAAVKKSLTRREDLWAQSTLPAPAVKAVLEPVGPRQHMFGRGGFSAQAKTHLPDGRIEFALPAAGDQEPEVRGYGVVRWSSRESLRVGVEFEYLDPACRAAILEAIATNPGRGFIPIHK